jgi:hypothetical protein
MTARLSALRVGRLYPQVSFLRFLVLISIRAWVDPRATVRLKGLGKLEKNPPHREAIPWPSVCSTVPQPLPYKVPPTKTCKGNKYIQTESHWMVLTTILWFIIWIIYKFVHDFLYSQISVKPKQLWRKCLWSISRYYPDICLERLMKSMDISQNIW